MFQRMQSEILQYMDFSVHSHNLLQKIK